MPMSRITFTATCRTMAPCAGSAPPRKRVPTCRGRALAEAAGSADSAVIYPGRAHGPHFFARERASGDSVFRGHIGERAIAVVVVELVLIHAGDEQIGLSVVIVISHGDAHP